MIEMEQMMERLLEGMEAKMDSNQKKAEADWDELKAIMNAEIKWTPTRKSWRPAWRNWKK
jgi:hypothetical protein